MHLAQPIWTFTKNLKILKGRLPPEDSSDRRETLGKRVSDDFAKMIFRGEKIFRGDIFWKIENFEGLFIPRTTGGLGKYYRSTRKVLQKY